MSDYTLINLEREGKKGGMRGHVIMFWVNTESFASLYINGVNCHNLLTIFLGEKVELFFQ